ncbi:MAG: Gfo/Idh/MocA family oxidoreductase [Firmicutes bacterium]|nr:Gfo/Idh/MocA family oxidoreductase [Bacillota bacterium]
MSQHRVILVGAGDMGGHHARAWAAVGQTIAAVVDPDVQRRAALAENYQVRETFSDLEEALARCPDGDIVDVAVPLKHHAPLVIAAARRGRHVLVEKPVARTLAEVDAMQDAVSRAGVVAAVGFQRNLSPGVAFLRDLVRQNRFGRPLLFTAEGFAEIRPKRFMHDAEDNNGPLVDLLGHYFLLWESVFESQPERIYADGFVLAHDRPELQQFAKKAIDTGTVVVRYASGDVATMTVSWGLSPKTRVPWVPERLFGPNAVAIGGAFKDFTWEGFTIIEGDQETFHPLPLVNPFALQAQAFIEAVEGRRPAPPSTLEDGRRMLRLSLAALQSIATGEPVHLALEPKEG